MKLKYLALAVVPFGLVACQSAMLSETGHSAMKPAQVTQTLSAYDWNLDTKAEKPMVLHFDESGRLSIETTCNNLMGSWQVQEGKINTGNMASTMKACSDTAMQQERLAGQIFATKQVNYSLNTTNLNSPTLTLTTAQGQSYQFVGKMTSETKYQSQAETIFLEISPQTKQCQGVVPQTCLQVKEIKYDAQGLKTGQDANWRLFYDPIEGFTHNPNLEQIIRVKRYEIKKPAADQSKYAYVYDMTVMSGIIR